MKKESLRMFLWIALVMVGFFLYMQWEQLNLQKQQVQQPSVSTSNSSQGSNFSDVPEMVEPKLKTTENNLVHPTIKPTPLSRLVTVKTDVLELDLDLKGGDITKLILSKYPENIKKPEEGFVLLDSSSKRSYVAQSGLLSTEGPDSKQFGRAVYSSSEKNYFLSSSTDKLFVDLFYTTPSNVQITKRFIFTRGSYLVNVDYIIKNNSTKPYTASFYGRLKRKPEQESSGFMGMRTYTGAAVNTPDKAYYKLPFSDMAKEPFRQTINGGWAAMIEHYFTSAWIPSKSAESIYSSEVLANDTYGVRYVSSPVTVLPGAVKTINNRLYAGPEITDDLKAISPGLELTVDYGILWPICQPIFWVLKTIHKFVANWGVAIILTTVLIKLLFYKLSASSYRSMGNMRKLQPRIEALKQRYGDDKQGFGQAVMGLYRQEKVNPLGGCLPILVQIPVFIALYYVLLESVELRHAPFMLWINDLSAKDPYFVLPILMGASMLIQQKLSPAPPDPVQAKVMMAMPVVFTFLFIQFPAGLVLYWVVNNVLSIAQQWVITKRIEAKK